MTHASILATRVRVKYYLDSVALMRYSSELAGRDGIEEAAMMMGTPANVAIMTNAGLLNDESPASSAGDLIISIRGASDVAVNDALAHADHLLDAQKTVVAGDNTVARPRTIRDAIAAQPESNLALISVPGPFAASEARKAIRRGLHTMIFSDNVSVEEEVSLKQEATRLGALVMGPDCGTAIINGVPLAFANVVNRGATGIVGASGTGIQEVSSLISLNGGGISHAIGVGGRDLTEPVGGLSTLTALDVLANDNTTQQIIVISKPPAPAVAVKVLERLGAMSVPVTVCFIGQHPDQNPDPNNTTSGNLNLPANVTQVSTLKAAAESALGVSPIAAAAFGQRAPDLTGQQRIVGLYSGGTLCAETQVILTAAGLSVQSNAPVPGSARFDALVTSDSLGTNSHHTLIDLGSDEYTEGRPHPMIEPAVRDASLLAVMNGKLADVLLLDVVLGYGSHDDPAGHLVSVLSSIPHGSRPLMIASVTGTPGDPQNRERQIKTLTDAGVVVMASNADAASAAVFAVGRKPA